jgi:hypothetical protein
MTTTNNVSTTTTDDQEIVMTTDATETSLLSIEAEDAITSGNAAGGDSHDEGLDLLADIADEEAAFLAEVEAEDAITSGNAAGSDSHDEGLDLLADIADEEAAFLAEVEAEDAISSGNAAGSDSHDEGLDLLADIADEEEAFLAEVEAEATITSGNAAGGDSHDEGLDLLADIADEEAAFLAEVEAEATITFGNAAGDDSHDEGTDLPSVVVPDEVGMELAEIEAGVLGQGIAAVYKGPSKTFLFPDLIMKVRVSDLINLQFVHMASVSPPARVFLSENASGAQATMPKINQTTLVSLPIPLPPLAEQHRIVAKVDELMALCDQLEAGLATTADTRRRLLDALLAEALDPASVGEMEMATVTGGNA